VPGSLGLLAGPIITAPKSRRLPMSFEERRSADVTAVLETLAALVSWCVEEAAVTSAANAVQPRRT
jgi:hypothetical protein